MDALRGVSDCFKGAFIVETARPIAPDGAPAAQPPRLERRDDGGPSVLLNPLWRCVFSVGVFGVCGLGIAVFDMWTWAQLLLVFESEALCLGLLFLVVMLLNNLVFQDIADLAFDRTAGSQPSILKSLTRMLADTVSNVLMHMSFLLQAHLFGMLPVGSLTIFFLVHLSLLCSLNAFDYKWRSVGWGLAQRIRFVEDNWIYFVGFGMPLAFFTWLPSSFFLRGVIFIFSFPFLIVAAYATTRPTGPAR
ncbi:hypothetical protein V5799_006549 [Amblyomma americanum]|uniref:Uncharacterized protein n=1 Tax=Amblyomma americanum TaxID=6943 RepID=A0AAQ4DW31_AMBAM